LDQSVIGAGLRHAGRVWLASLFLLAGLNKILNPEATLAMMADAGLAPGALLLPAVIALELGAGALVAAGWRFVVPAALALAVFTLATNVFFHAFWTLDGEMRALQLSLFFKNVAVAGALVYVAGTRMKERGALA
jgi:putative oxidoreductase